jgi:hypothetical protein
MQDGIAVPATFPVSQTKGCGSDGAVESLEKQKPLFHPSHRSLEISPKARDSHTPTAPASTAWKSGKPKAGFPLSHAGLATTTPVLLILQTKQGRACGPTERKKAVASLFPALLPVHFRLEIPSTFMLILGLENAAVERVWPSTSGKT